jgi:8-oxo-dGTP diphosphatase
MKRVRVVAALIPHRGDLQRGDGSPVRYLVQQRLPNASRANLWEFPGGKVEPGETDEAALARECREELDVELTVGKRLWGVEHTYTDLVVQLELYAAQLVGDAEPKVLGAQALRFCTPVEMQALPFCEADIPLLEALVRGAL